MFYFCSVQLDAEMTERHARALAELAELCLASARDLAARQAAAEDPADAAVLAAALHKVGRSVRQCLALEARLLRERQRVERETRDDAAKQRSLQTTRRRAQVQSALNQLIWNEYENPEAEALEMVVDDRLDAEELTDSFTAEPLAAQVERIRKSIGLDVEPPPASPAPEPDRVPPPIDDDHWRSSA